jgi:DNA-directed RNA polymerase specialized sigma24 family protein
LQDDDGQVRRSRQAWKDLVEAGRLADRGPEEIVAACRRPDEIQDERLRGRLLEHLCALARPFLTRRANKDMPNGGLDAVDEIVSNMSTAILDPAAKDGAGYEAAFYTKLQQRLTDRHRAWRVQQARVEPLPLDEETGETLEPADAVGLTPEEAATVESLIANLPEKFRRAFLLHRAGFPVTSKGECVSRMLGVTPKTAEDWIRKAIALLREQLGSKP